MYIRSNMATIAAPESKLKASLNLIIVQIALFLVPLFAVPYIVARVGIEHYGAFVFCQTIMGLLSVVISYGFMHTAIRDIAQCKTLRRLRHEFRIIFYARFAMLMVTAGIALSLLTIEKIAGEKTLYLYSFLYLFVTVFDLAFVYQGVEQLRDYAVLSLIGSGLVVILLVFLVRRTEDYVYLPVIFTVPRLLMSFVGVIWIQARLHIGLGRVHIRGVLDRLKRDLRYFISNMFMLVYTRATIVMLGILSTNVNVALYAIADQVIFAYSMIQGKVSTVYHPQIAKALQNALADGADKARESVQLMSLLSVTGVIFIEFFAHEILSVFVPASESGATVVLSILALNIITISISSILGIQILLSLKRDGELLLPSICAAALNMTLGALLIATWGHIGAAIAVVSIETFVCAYMYRRVMNYGVIVFTPDILWPLAKYSVVLLTCAFVIKLALSSLGVAALASLALGALLYAAMAVIMLQSLEIIDFRGRRVLIGNNLG